MQGDFQRTFIMMRPLDAQQSGSTGFCRVERKQNRGKLAFNVQGIAGEEPLHAVMIRQDGGQFKVSDCGRIPLDGRGQGTVTRDVENLGPSGPSTYQAVGVVSKAEGQARLLMIGFFGTGKPVEREKIEAASAATLGIKAPVPEAKPVLPPTLIEEEEAQAPAEPEASTVPETPPIPQEVQVPEPPPVAEAPEPPPVVEALSQESRVQAEPPPINAPESIWSTPPTQDGEFPAVGLPEELEGVIWPESTQSLRELFERFDVVSPVTGNDAEVFIRIPMNDCISGVDHYLLGVRLAGGAVVAVGYAIPGTADAPPTGLIGYTFTETPLGGYWIKWEDVSTGT